MSVFFPLVLSTIAAHVEEGEKGRKMKLGNSDSFYSCVTFLEVEMRVLLAV